MPSTTCTLHAHGANGVTETLPAHSQHMLKHRKMTLHICQNLSLPTTSLFRTRHRFSTSSAIATAAVRILEVGPRDGLKNIKTQVSIAIKMDLIEMLAATGLRNIEATSFVPPKWIPQLADSHDVMAQIGPWARRTGLQLPVLVPNTRGPGKCNQSRSYKHRNLRFCDRRFQ